MAAVLVQYVSAFTKFQLRFQALEKEETKMNSGLSTNTVERVIGVLQRHPEVEEAVLYGSRAKGDYRPGSDIDLSLCGSKLNHALLTCISNELDDLMLPYQIDLSLMSSLTHPALLDHIERVGTMLYKRAAGALPPSTHYVGAGASS